jgi:hypothetical protein
VYAVKAAREVRFLLPSDRPLLSAAAERGASVAVTIDQVISVVVPAALSVFLMTTKSIFRWEVVPVSEPGGSY